MRTAENETGLSKNSAGYFRRYWGKVRATDGTVKPLHVTYSRDLDESRWIDGIWKKQRDRLAAHLGVTATAVIWPQHVADETRNCVAELRQLDRESVEREEKIREALRKKDIIERLHSRVEAVQLLGNEFPPPSLAKLPPVTTAELRAVDVAVTPELVQSGIVANSTTTTGQSIDDALTAYTLMVADDPSIESSTRRRTGEAITSLRRHAAAMNPALDLTAAMSGVTYGELERLTNRLKSRPVSKKTGGPISAGTVRTELQKWHGAFDWIDRNNDRFGWEWPRRAKELFQLVETDIMSKDERDAKQNGDDTIVPRYHEIAAYLESATNDQRAQILTAIFGAQGQTELSVMRRKEFSFQENKLTHNRNKTSVRGVYFIPPELVSLLSSAWQKTPGNDAFVTSKGTPIVTDKSDSVRQWFDDLRNKVIAEQTELGVCGVRRELSFYDFRRVLANHPDVIARGLDEVALSQTHKKVSRKNYSPSRESQHAELWEISKKLYVELKAAGAFGWAVENQPKPKRSK